MKTKSVINLLIISLHADPSMPPGVGEWGGTHTYMRELLTELCQENYNIILITRKVYEDESDIEIISQSCKILRLTLGEFGNFDKRNLFGLHEVTFQSTIKTLADISFKPDIIHSVYWNSGHLAMRLSTLWNISYVHSVISNGRGRIVHGAKGTSPYRIEVEEKVFENAKFILCVAESEKKELCKYYKINPDKIVVAGQFVHPAFIYAPHNSYGAPRKSGIHYKIESIYFSPLSIKEPISSDWWSKKAFTYTGRLSLDKGIHFIIQAWYLLLKKYRSNCPPLWIIGGSPSDIELIRPQLGIQEAELLLLENTNKLIWWGYLDENGISAIYTKSLVLITHSLYEPGGRVAVEAMCEGLPVLATPNGFALDALKDWNNGFLVPYGNVDLLAIRLEHFIKQPYLSTIMGQQAMLTGNAIVKNWSFKETHELIYEAALLNHRRIQKTIYELPSSDTLRRDVHTFPFNRLLTDEADIIQIAQNNNISHIQSVKKIHPAYSSSSFWSIKTEDEEYYVKIPYDRLNLFPLWADKGESPLIITSLKRYRAEIGAATFKELPELIGTDEQHRAIIRKKYICCDIPKNIILPTVIDKLQAFYQNSTFDAEIFMEHIDSLIQANADYKVIDQAYINFSKKYLPWQNYFMDYSLRVELLRWKHYYEILPSSSRNNIYNLFKQSYDAALTLSNREVHLTPVINHGGADLKNIIFIPDPVLLDNEKIHIGWPGIDYSDLAITYVRNHFKKETPEIWNDILSHISGSNITPQVFIGWIFLGTIKEAISNKAQFKSISPLLFERVKILYQLLE